ncbi:MAG TPA: VC_2705 family sodium/solute symporter [Methyloceanibacter sp.]|nr:VC_2705 family sodium/solute symporter [Methyloceanibacter sp.]
MSPPRRRQANPHLGAYYGILTSAFVSLAISLAMFEQLGWQETWVARAMILVPLALYVVIALGARTLNVEDFFASGRRVPPVYNGAVLAAVLIGGTGFFAYTGTLFFLGFDALAIGLAWTAGLIVSGILFVPYLRKAGAYTMPAFLGQRFRSRFVRAMASVLQLPPASLLLAAEIKVAALIIAMFLPLSHQLAVACVAVTIACVTIVGGMRSLTWSASAQFIVSAVGFAVPLIIVSVLLTNLPAPQLTYGEMFEPLKRSESVTGVSPSAPSEFATALPREQPEPSAKPFLQAFGAVSQTDFVTLFLCLTLGAAALPSLLARSGVTSSVADQRRSVAWGVFFVALFAISAPALAAFVRLMMFQDIAQAPANSLPSWLNDLSAYRLLFPKDANSDGAIEASELFVARDGVVLALPMAAKLPFVCTVLTAAAGLAIALAAAASHLFTLAGSLADDVIRLVDPRSEVLPRLMVAWVAIAATALAAGVFLAFAEIDVMQVAIMAFASAAAIFFPVLLLAIWWRRCTWLGAMLALGLGFATMATAIAFGDAPIAGQFRLTTVIAALIGAALGLIGGLIGSLLGPKPTPAEQAYFEELRDPSGDALYDRARRRAAAASQ